MKIFVGGMKDHHQRAFSDEFPHIEFEFAAFTDPIRKWARRAKHCDIIIIDQSRCSHTIVEHMRRAIHKPFYFTDSKAHMREIIKEATANGKVGYRYT